MATQDDHPSFEDSSAADEPTAMWDASALKDLGLEEAAKTHEAKDEPKALAAPVNQQKTGPARPKTVPKKGARKSQSMSTGMLVVVAVALGAAVYFAVSLALG